RLPPASGRERGLHVLAEAVRSQGAGCRGEGGPRGLTPPVAAKGTSLRRRSPLHAGSIPCLSWSVRVPDYEVVPPEEAGAISRRRRAKPRMPALTIERYGGRLI